MKGALLLFSCWDVTLFLKKKKKNRLQLPSYSPFIHVSQHVFKESKIFKLILIVKIFRERGRVISLIHVHMYCYSPCLWGATCLYIVVDEVGAFGTWGTSFITILYVFLNCSSLFLSSTPPEIFGQAKNPGFEVNFLWLEILGKSRNQCCNRTHSYT